MQSLTKRTFSSLYNYSCQSNPRVWVSVANNGNEIGKMVFELYENKQPAYADHFKTLCAGAEHGKSYKGSEFSSGMAGLGISAGSIDEENNGAFGVWNPDGDLSLRHHKRGLLTSYTDQTNRNGGQFMITFGEAQMLNGS